MAFTSVTVASSASDSGNRYSKAANKELKSRALMLVKGVRELVHSYSRTDRNLTADFDAEYLATRTTRLAKTILKFANVLALEVSADDLELLSKSLPHLITLQNWTSAPPLC